MVIGSSAVPSRAEDREISPKMLTGHLRGATLTLVVPALLWPAFKVVARLGLHEDAYVQILAAP